MKGARGRTETEREGVGVEGGGGGRGDDWSERGRENVHRLLPCWSGILVTRKRPHSVRRTTSDEEPDGHWAVTVLVMSVHAQAQAQEGVLFFTYFFHRRRLWSIFYFLIIIIITFSFSLFF